MVVIRDEIAGGEWPELVGPTGGSRTAGTAGPSSATHRSYLEALLTGTAVRAGSATVAGPSSPGPSSPSGACICRTAGPSSSYLQGVRQSKKEAVVPVQEANPIPDDPVEELEVMQAQPMQGQVEGGPAINNGAVDSEDGFKVVMSRKFGMPRGMFPDPPYMSPPEKVCENEFPWVPKVGSPREVTKWAQLRKGIYLDTQAGQACFTYGTFGPTSLER